MRRILILTAACLVLACSKPLVVVIPSLGPGGDAAPRPSRIPEGCRYSSVVVTHPSGQGGRSGSDLALNAKIAEMMRHELGRLGAAVTRDPSDAYWSLMVLAAVDERHYDGFLFSATLALRQLNEGHDPGVTAYAGGSGHQLPTVYSGLGYGPGYALRTIVRDFVRRADAALLPVAHTLCEQDERERSREAQVDRQAPGPAPL